MKVSRRIVLRGLGGAALSLPFLEGQLWRLAKAQDRPAEFAIFFRQANGVNGESGADRFWPKSTGALTESSLSGQALDVLMDVRSKLLVVGDVNMLKHNYGDGHARGILQALTAAGPVVKGAGGNAQANGESLDHRIGQDLNPEGRESLYLYAGLNDGWLGGACMSYREAGRRRSPINNPWQAYQTVVGEGQQLSAEARDQLVNKQRSINDLVQDQMSGLLRSPKLSKNDRSRLELHSASVRDIELRLGCAMNEDKARQLENQSPGFDSTNGDDVIRTAKLHMDVAALAVACGYTRSVAIQVGSGNDGKTQYRDPRSNRLMENFHYISHRRASHGSDGDPIPNSDLLHHYVDRHFAGMFKHLVDQLSAQEGASGSGSLLDQGVAVWFNDQGLGPGHTWTNVPQIVAGSARGKLKQGQYIKLGTNQHNHNQFLNTIGGVMGLKGKDGAPLNDFGDADNPKGRIDQLLA